MSALPAAQCAATRPTSARPTSARQRRLAATSAGLLVALSAGTSVVATGITVSEDPSTTPAQSIHAVGPQWDIVPGPTTGQ